MKGFIKPVWVLAAFMILSSFAACEERSNIPHENGGGGGGGGPAGADSWTALSLTNAPTARWGHSAIWTGTEMIVWGGLFYDDVAKQSKYLKSGSRYNPTTDSWTATAETKAPDGRHRHTAVWTGSTMIVWGGFVSNNVAGWANTGGIYNPAANSWSATSTTDAPSPRINHSAVWTGTEMIIWGGSDYERFPLDPSAFPLGSGGRFNPSLDIWQPIPQVLNSTTTARESHCAFWTGTEMLVWGGYYQRFFDTYYLNNGAKYDPETDSWVDTSVVNAPAPRVGFSAVWTGTSMIVWGGFHVDNTASPGIREYLNTGGIYDPVADTWTEISTTGAPEPRDEASAVWTGTDMIVWGGFSLDASVNPVKEYFYTNGAKYNLEGNSWKAIANTGAPEGRFGQSTVWTGKEMIIWGGENYTVDPTTREIKYSYLNSGARYKP